VLTLSRKLYECRALSDGAITPDKFDPAAVEMMRKLGTKKGGAKTHYWPLAMATYDIMPPPVAMEKTVGEVRQLEPDVLSTWTYHLINLKLMPYSLDTYALLTWIHRPMNL